MRFVEWLWTTGALLLGRVYIVLILGLVLTIAAAWLHSWLHPPPPLRLPPDHPLIDRRGRL